MESEALDWGGLLPCWPAGRRSRKAVRQQREKPG